MTISGEMSRSSHPHGYLPLPSFPSPFTINFSTIPRSHNHSSDESEAGSPSPSGAGHLSTSHRIQNPELQEDTPYVPRRGHHRGHYQQRGTRAGVALSPDTHSYEYDHSTVQAQSPAGELHRDRDTYGSTYNQAIDTPGIFTDDRAQWKASPGSVGPDTYYRPQLSYPPDEDYQVGASGFVGESPQASYDLPQRSSPSSSSGYDSSAAGLHPNSFVSAPDTEEYLRQQLDIRPYQPVNLWALPDPPPGQKPSQPLPVLIKLAIHGSPKKKLTLREIYLALEERFVWFRETSDKAWKGSIRHNLSLNKVFRNILRPITEPGKGRYWVLDISDGEGYKRERKRRSRKLRFGEGDDDDDDDLSDDEGAGSSSTGSPVPSGSVSVQQQQEPQSGACRIRSSPRATSPYPQPGASTTAFSSQAGYGTGPIPAAGASQSYHRVDTSSSQAAFGRAGFGESTYRQHSFGQPSLGPGTRVYPQPVLAQQGQRRTERAHTAPNPRSFSPSSGVYGMTPLQNASSPEMMMSLRRSPIEQHQQFSGYVDGISDYNAVAMSSDNVSAQYDLGQCDPRIGMGRGSQYPDDQAYSGRGRNL